MQNKLNEDQIEQISALAHDALYQVNAVRESWFEVIYEDLRDEQRKSEDEEYLELIANIIEGLNLAEIGLDTPASATEWIAQSTSLAEMTREHVVDQAHANRDALVGVARQIDKVHTLAERGADELGLGDELPINATAIKFPHNKLRKARVRYDAIISAARAKEPMK